MQSDSTCAKLFLQCKVLYIFFCLIVFQRFFILQFYHLPFVTLSIYFHILSLFIFSRVILLLTCKIQFAFFTLENDLGEIETSSNFIASFYLKTSCFCAIIFDTKQANKSCVTAVISYSRKTESLKSPGSKTDNCCDI